MMKKPTTRIAIGVAIALGLIACAATGSAPVNSLRGSAVGDAATDNTTPGAYKVVYDSSQIDPRGAETDPPVIPHLIDGEGYSITVRKNECMDCHSDENYKDEGSVRVSDSHFVGAGKQGRTQLSGKHYICTQCHVTQTDAKALVRNNFRGSKAR